MHLTQLTLDSRHASLRRDLSNAYDMHRTLARAFATQPDAPPERFLWRLDALDALTGRAVVLIQSNQSGVWDHLPTPGAQVREKPFNPALLAQAGQRCRFRLLANPTVSRQGKRYGVWEEAAQRDWLVRQLSQAGATVEMVECTRNERWVLRKPGQLEPIVLCAIGFEGVLTVDKPDALQHALRNGIGRGKSFGLGLLSLAPLRDW